MENLNATIGIPDNKEDYVIEVYGDTSFFAEIERIGDELSVKIYNHTKDDTWHIDLNQLYAILEKAKKELETS